MASGVELMWQDVLAEEKAKPYFKELMDKIEQMRLRGQVIYPSADQVFRALQLTPLAEVKVVILGQDPYHGPGQAHGLSFSVPAGCKIPPSLRNIYKSLEHDLGLPQVEHGDLTSWAERGVLLLNSVLTVTAAQAASHSDFGWQRLTDAIIAAVSRECRHVVFMLWGAYAGKKVDLIDQSRHCVLAAPHPSPLSAHRGFLTARHFSMANEYRVISGLEPLDWSLPVVAG